ncbi:stage III sporulation protein SpoIIIAB [Bacillus fonticola]|uniref:stage III sporulation protein SpoIIIAB n=1 Tax=Bacillus fonticola TaxID=2728853 RepID=UPI001474BCE1|nr:stage III sporulation protein SpoIIIAB [Bacillus fonticola]
MIKIVGAICILAATTWIGFEFSRQFSERPRQLRQLKTALRSLEAEIMYGHTPLHEATRRLAKQMPNPIALLFSSFSKRLIETDTTASVAWETSLREVWKWTALNKGEFEVLSQFGQTLGKHDRGTQQKQIVLALTHLEREETEARDRQSKYEKMIKSLGVLSGLLLIVLFM